MEFNIVWEIAKQKWRAISDGDKADIQKIYEHVTTQEKIDEETLKVFASFFFKRGIPSSLNGIIQANR
jgi:uncharacterized membrane protein YvbJ